MNTGTLNSHGNESYGTTANSTTAVQWRGKENPWGNIPKCVDGINVKNAMFYIAKNYNFNDATTSNYKYIGFDTPTGYDKILIGRFGYNESFDWLFIPYGDKTGNTSLPVGDAFYKRSDNSWYDVQIGGDITSNTWAGPFNIQETYTVEYGYTNLGCRLLYVG